MEVCKNCDYTVPVKSECCPNCGQPMEERSSGWKKAGAWILLIVIMYGFVRCNLKMMQGLDKFQGEDASVNQGRGWGL